MALGLPPLARVAAEDFLIREARLLDEGRFEAWLGLFTADGTYRVPGGDGGDWGYGQTEGVDAQDPDAAGGWGPAGYGLPLIDDDRATLEDRILRLRSPATHSQSPPSRTLHVVGGVEVEPVAGPEPVRPDLRTRGVDRAESVVGGDARDPIGSEAAAGGPAGRLGVRSGAGSGWPVRVGVEPPVRAAGVAMAGADGGTSGGSETSERDMATGTERGAERGAETGADTGADTDAAAGKGAEAPVETQRGTRGRGQVGGAVEARVHSTLLVYEARVGVVRCFAGRCLYRLRRAEGGEGGWRIAAKTVWLINRDQALYNLTFLL